MTSIEEIRQKFPQYNDLSDDQLLRGLHEKHYSDIPYKEFLGNIMPEGGASDRYIEPIRSVINSAVSAPVAGWEGLTTLATTFDPIAAGDSVNKALQRDTYRPKTQTGQQGILDFQYAMEPIATAQDDLRRKFGDPVVNATGSPLLGTLAHSIPDGILSMGGMLVGSKAAPIIDGGLVATGNTVRQMIPQTKAKQEIAGLLTDGVEDVRTAGYELIPNPEGPTSLLQFGGPKVRKNDSEKKALRQDMSPETIVGIKGANTSTKNAMLQMLDIVERGRVEPKYGALNRPSDIVGSTIESRVKSVMEAKERAGQDVGRIARQELPGKQIDPTDILSKFKAGLDDMDIRQFRNEDGEWDLDFSESIIRKNTTMQNSVRELFEMIRDSNMTDAYDAHVIKRAIANDIDFGKNQQGLSAEIERLMNTTRVAIKDALNGKFPDYDEANSAYSELVGSLNEFQKAVGPSVDLNSPNIDKTLGVAAKSITSERITRGRLLDALSAIDAAHKKYSGRGKPLLTGASDGEIDLLSLVTFSNDLREIFGTTAKTGFKAEVEAGVRRGAGATTEAGRQAGLIDFGVDLAKDKVFGLNEQNALKAFRELLNQDK